MLTLLGSLPESCSWQTAAVGVGVRWKRKEKYMILEVYVFVARKSRPHMPWRLTETAVKRHVQSPCAHRDTTLYSRVITLSLHGSKIAMANACRGERFAPSVTRISIALGIPTRGPFEVRAARRKPVVSKWGSVGRSRRRQHRFCCAEGARHGP